ncbi:MAG: hypothetical protein K6E11_02090 [Bacilli bacterium]|nr:hypothetical protein [Bacilli bacterium]
MKLFSNRETLLENMTLMGIMASINIIIAVIAAFFPVFSLFLVLILPLSSTLVELFCKDRYFPIYAFATIGLALVATIWNMETTIFYVIPSILTGYIFGLMSKKNVPAIYSILAASVAQAGVTIAFIPFINFVFDVDVIFTFKSFFKLTESIYIDEIVPAFIFAISMVQIVLSYLIVSNEVKKFGFEPKDDEKYRIIYQIACFVCSLAIIPFAFFFVKGSYVFLMIAIYFAVFIVLDFIYKRKWFTLGVLLFGIVINVIVFALAYSKLDGCKALLLVGVTPLWIGFISIAFSLLKRESKKIQ